MQRAAKSILFVLLLLPFLLLIKDISTGALIDPIEEITVPTGQWALRLLLVVLAITPLVRLTRWRFIIKWRRMIGLFAFFYALLHLSIWLIDQQFDLAMIIEDITKRTYITVGFSALLLMTPLAITSTNGWMRRLGRRWKRLHRLVYVIVILGVIHFYWQSKSDMALEPFIYAGIALILLGYRAVDHFARTRS